MCALSRVEPLVRKLFIPVPCTQSIVFDKTELVRIYLRTCDAFEKSYSLRSVYSQEGGKGSCDILSYKAGIINVLVRVPYVEQKINFFRLPSSHFFSPFFSFSFYPRFIQRISRIRSNFIYSAQRIGLNGLISFFFFTLYILLLREYLKLRNIYLHYFTLYCL